MQRDPIHTRKKEYREGAPEEWESRRGTAVLSSYGPTMSTYNSILWRSGKLMVSLPSPLSLRPDGCMRLSPTPRVNYNSPVTSLRLGKSPALDGSCSRGCSRTNARSHRFLFLDEQPDCWYSPVLQRESLSLTTAPVLPSPVAENLLVVSFHFLFPLCAVQPGGPHLACVEYALSPRVGIAR